MNGEGEDQPASRVTEPVDRLVFLTTVATGAFLLLLVVLTTVGGVQLKFEKWIMATGVALLCGATLSRIALSLKVPATGQQLTLGGTFAAVFVLLTQVPDPQSQIGRGTIQVMPGLQDVVLRSSHTPIFVRRGDDRTIEFMLFQNDVQAPFWTISLSMVEGGGRRPKWINCLPRQILDDAARSTKSTDLIIVPSEEVNSDGSRDRVFKLRNGAAAQPVGVPDEAAICGLPDGTTARPAGALPARPAAEPAAAPAAPALSSVVSALPPAPAASADTTARAISDATRELRSGNLDQRLQASAALASVVSTNADTITQTITSWQVARSDYDDDLGRLLGWLKPLRRLKENPAPAQKMLEALTPAQTNYLVALLSSQDRPLRLAARETVGWLLQVNAPTALGKLLQPIMATVRDPGPSLSLVEDKFHETPRSRRFFIYNLIDVQLDGWCGFSAGQRQSMLQAIQQVAPGDLGADGIGKAAEIRAKACQA